MNSHSRRESFDQVRELDLGSILMKEVQGTKTPRANDMVPQCEPVVKLKQKRPSESLAHAL